MGQQYNKDYSQEEIKKILAIIHNCIERDYYYIATNSNRLENQEFINNYNLNSTKQKEILLGIVIEDFCYSLQNKKQGYEHEILYVFCSQKKLHDFEGNEKLVDIYIKINIINNKTKKRIIIISFHQRNKKISYLFR